MQRLWWYDAHLFQLLFDPFSSEKVLLQQRNSLREWQKAAASKNFRTAPRPMCIK